MKYYHWKRDFTEHERKAIIKGMAEIVKGYIFETVEDVIATAMEDAAPMFCGKDNIVFPWKIDIVGNDILAQAGILRRNNENGD